MTSVVSKGIDPALNGQLIDEYQSASGKQCQRFSQVASRQILVQCRQQGGAWQTAKSLDGIYTEGYLKMVQTVNMRELNSTGGITDTESVNVLIDQVAGAELVDAGITNNMDTHNVDTSSESSDQLQSEQFESPLEVRVEPGESLWDVATRVTGSGNNWTVIARANDLRDANLLKTGQILIVPPSVLNPK